MNVLCRYDAQTRSYFPVPMIKRHEELAKFYMSLDEDERILFLKCLETEYGMAERGRKKNIIHVKTKNA